MKISYATHTAWSNPGSFRSRLSELPDAPRLLADVLENFMIHHGTAHLLDIRVPEIAKFDRRYRTVERLLSAAVMRDRRPLNAQRELSDYLYVGSREFALIAACILRSTGAEARLRVGFVDYFRENHWEEHWLCEYWAEGAWKLLDTQLGWRARGAYGIKFAADDVPQDRFMSASQLWNAIRSGKIKAAQCGQHRAGISGVWLPAASIMKDVATLCGFEPLPTDYWGPAIAFSRNRAVPVRDYDELDALALSFSEAPRSPFEARALAEKYPWSIPGSAITNVIDELPFDLPVGRQPVVRHFHVHARIQEARANS
ncbi:MAG: hypothetical protein GY789_00205 [Hyphomicrobiales bacterium]|nr:hypothetical protein [Hyphomicrobiales bacterium]MCP4998117.1 hypothetical protein [Hyphomicrobiales bacterium]